MLNPAQILPQPHTKKIPLRFHKDDSFFNRLLLSKRATEHPTWLLSSIKANPPALSGSPLQKGGEDFNGSPHF
jgi:hypothetical protein